MLPVNSVNSVLKLPILYLNKCIKTFIMEEVMQQNKNKLLSNYWHQKPTLKNKGLTINHQTWLSLKIWLQKTTTLEWLLGCRHRYQRILWWITKSASKLCINKISWVSKGDSAKNNNVECFKDASTHRYQRILCMVYQTSNIHTLRGDKSYVKDITLHRS